MVPGEFFFILQLAYNFNHGGIDTLFQVSPRHFPNIKVKLLKSVGKVNSLRKGLYIQLPAWLGSLHDQDPR